MTDTHRENLSAGVDGELTAEELRFLLRRIDHDAALQHAWSRYHLSRDGVRGKVPPLASARFAARVMLAIEQESGVAVTGRRHWLRWSAGGAIAASVAVAALMVARPVGPGADDSINTAAVSTSQDAGVSNVTQATAPAAAPPWLNRYAGLPSQLTQQAAATVDSGEGTYLYGRNPSNPYQIERYRAINNGDGSYLLLLHPDQQAPQQTVRQAAANQ